MLTDDVRYKLLRLLDANPKLSQRGVARELGVSVGKVNFCIRALIERGFVKASRFKNSQNKVGYMYLLTPSGLQHKARLTAHFLKLKLMEYAELHAEIERLRNDTVAPTDRRRP
jgi:EPS-associated MarR family transcriptional regulator